MSQSLADILRGEQPRPDAGQAPPDEGQTPPGGLPDADSTDAAAPGEVPEAGAAPGEDAAQAGNGAPPAPGTRQVPLAALEATRREKNDFKTQAAEANVRLEERNREVAELRRQIDEIKRGAPAPAPATPGAPAQQQAQPQSVPFVPHPTLPNPVEDPEGYGRAIRENIEHENWNQRLNWSEANLTRQHGAEAVQAKTALFREAVAENPRLAQQFRAHPDPYAFVFEQADRYGMTRDIAKDPAAYRARLEAEIRASLEQPSGGDPAPAGTPASTKPVPTLPSSLASARSAGERSAPAWTGPPPLADIIKR